MGFRVGAEINDLLKPRWVGTWRCGVRIGGPLPWADAPVAESSHCRFGGRSERRGATYTHGAGGRLTLEERRYSPDCEMSHVMWIMWRSRDSSPSGPTAQASEEAGMRREQSIMRGTVLAGLIGRAGAGCSSRPRVDVFALRSAGAAPWAIGAMSSAWKSTCRPAHLYGRADPVEGLPDAALDTRVCRAVAI